MADKDVDKDSYGYRSGYEDGYQEKDKSFLSSLAEVFNPSSLLHGENHNAGYEDGRADRERDDLQDFKNEVRKK